jgi:hypothetical protein
MASSSAVEEGWVGVVYDLRRLKILVMLSCIKKIIGCSVARKEYGRFGNSVVVSSPKKLDAISNRSVDGERNEAKDTLCGRNDNSMSNL